MEYLSILEEVSMKELSLHILDVVENSFKAEATLVTVKLFENTEKNEINIFIRDNGRGMSREVLENVINPFFTTRTTRKVGLGLSLLKATAERCNGGFSISSELGAGTEVEAHFERNNIDLPPIGDFATTIVSLIGNSYNCDILLVRKLDKKEYKLDTREIKKTLECEDLNEVDILMWIKEYLKEKEDNLLDC